MLVQALPRSHKANLLAIVLGVGMAFFLAIEPTQEWLLLILAGLAAGAAEGAGGAGGSLRLSWRRNADTICDAGWVASAKELLGERS